MLNPTVKMASGFRKRLCLGSFEMFLVVLLKNRLHQREGRKEEKSCLLAFNKIGRLVNKAQGQNGAIRQV